MNLQGYFYKGPITKSLTMYVKNDANIVQILHRIHIYVRYIPKMSADVGLEAFECMLEL